MEVCVGRFVGYLPDKDPADIILALLSRAVRIEESILEPSFLHSFLFKMKKELPVLLEDVHFSETSFLPYSEEVDFAMRELKGAGFIVRPNPKYASFTLKVSGPIDAKWMSDEDKNSIQRFSKTLAKELHARR